MTRRLWRRAQTTPLLLLSVLMLETAAAQTPVLPNGSFEQVDGDVPAGWRRHAWNGGAVMELAAGGRDGGRCVLIASDTGADVMWTTTVLVEPSARYRLSGWIRTVDVKGGGRGALLNIQGQPFETPALTGTQDWREVQVEFDTGELDAVQVNCLFGGWGQSTGRAWYDDLRLELLSRTPTPPPQIAIAADQVGAPLSRYIYGQFIEHLGRCIYGGIWAEIIDDRKFYWPVGQGESPWKVSGPAGAVVMRTDGAFVGAHSPAIQLAGAEPRGLAQEKLGVRGGVEYVGRIWLAGTPQAGPVQVTLIWGPTAAERQSLTIANLGGEFTRHHLKFAPAQTTDAARLEITATGQGEVRIGTLSLMPADHVQGLRPDTLALLKELNAPIYRWPGGNFVSGYDWRDGIGERDRRPPRKNPAWQGVEHNDFGLDEFIQFCRVVGAEPYIALNSGLGDVRMAVEELEYANAAADTPQGRKRAANGHADPYGVEYWGIGNEMYGNWQLGHMPLEQYTRKHNEFAAALRQADPGITLVAVGAVGPWSERMLSDCAAHMNLLSEHFYRGAQPGLRGHVRQIPDAIREIANAHRRYRGQLPSLKGRDIRIALDEWNYWYGPDIFGEIGTRYFLKDALGIAAGLHEYARQSDIYFMANYAQTVNVIGALKTTGTAAAFETTGLVLKLYRTQFGTLPVATTASAGLDVQAAWTEDRSRLTIGVVNPSRTPLEIPLALRGARLTGAGVRWEIAGADPEAYNHPGEPPRVQLVDAPLQDVSDTLRVAPCSVTLFVLGAAPAPAR